MSKRIFVSLIALLLCAAMCFGLVACGDEPTAVESSDETTTTVVITPEKKNTLNESKTLIIQESTFDGVFSPFFYSSAYDGDVVGMINVGLLTVDATGAVVAGPEYDTVAQSYSVYYTDDLTNFTKKDTYEEGNYVVYEMVLKNGAKFSDGTAITADDVLFNYYVYLDPAYTGSSTLYTLPILGLTDYRTQVAGSEKYGAIADKIFATGDAGYTETADFTEEQYKAYWAGVEKAGVAFANEIVNYVEANYKGTEYTAGGTKYSGKTAVDFSVEGEKIATGMAMWGFGSYDVKYVVSATGTKSSSGKTLYVASEAETSFFDADGKYYAQATAESTGAFYTLDTYEATDAGYKCVFKDYKDTDRYAPEYADTFTAACTGKNYTMTGTDYPTVADYWENLKLGYADDDGVVDYQNLSDTESAGMDLLSAAKENFTLAYANVGSIPSITGLSKGTTTVDGETHETVKVVLTEQNPKAILSLGVTVAPKAYYTAGYTYTDGALVNFGCELGINGNAAFMNHLQSLNSAPIGAGTYKFVSFDGDGVTLVRNDYHETMGNDNVYNAKIKNVYLKVIDSGKEFDALKAGDVHYSNPSASADVVAEIATIENITSILVDNLGYGYICVNPSAEKYGLDNLYARIALTTVFDLSQVNEYYPNGLADIIYRSQSQVSWAYPEGAEAIYAYDETLASAIMYYQLAGYTYDEATGKFTDVPEIDFYLPSNTDDHPAGGIFLKAQELLAKIGITANIKVDANLIANIKKDHIPVYALAWSSSQDPDMYQVNHYKSAAESVFSNGISWLHENGKDSEKGTVLITKLDGSQATMNQTEALEYLAELIEEGVKYMSVEERKPIYEKALEVLAQLNIEIPTYQRKNMFAYDNTVVDATSLSTTVTPYWGPIAEVWKVSFVNGDATID